MQRAVMFDPEAPAAAAAARAVADEFDVATWAAETATEAVVLVGPKSSLKPSIRTRLIAVVDPLAPGPWPEQWYAVVPEGSARDVVARAVRNAFADLHASADVARLERELHDLNAIGIQLTAERDPDRLLEMILRTAREITLSDAGSLYLVEETRDGARQLRFALAQNDSMPVPWEESTLPLDRQSVAGFVALSGEPLNLGDAYTLPEGAAFDINRSYDARIGYRTKSMLVVPMRAPQGEIIGVVQLINCKPSLTTRLRSPDEVERLARPFPSRFVQLVSSLASQAAVALLNSRLYDDIRRLFDGFVRASVIAIESRDPTTAGHSFRVADLTVALAEAANRGGRGRLAYARLDDAGLRELRYAALLHDFGKVAVRERVLGKAKKLHPEMLERIRHRVEVLKREVELTYAHRKLQYVLDHGARDFPAQAAALDVEMAAALAELDACLTGVLRVNEPTVFAPATRADIDAIARRTFADRTGAPRPVITPDEAEILAIARGSLTSDEYVEVRSHVVHTFQFLAQIPWTHEFRRLPEIARDHHEKLDGSGYPRGIRGEAIPLQTRMMTIADIYDALTAFDRPYKPAISPENAIDILDHERRAGRLDGELLDLFIAAKVYEVTRARAGGSGERPGFRDLDDPYY
ncbi:MAG: GAF domain-containing protein [Candidatus Rokubacteria bacterium]|nr:GAF domain-containing protein [Candidatus Rokubacteria bacterium]